MNTLIPATTAAVTTAAGAIKLDSSHYQFPVTIVANGLTGAETITVNITDDGVNYSPMLDYNTGTAVVLDATHNNVGIQFPADLQLVKSATVAAVAAGLSTAANA